MVSSHHPHPHPPHQPPKKQPENVLLQSDGITPVLIDFGSMAAADRRVASRSEALLVQEDAATHSTMPYRAPELFDVASDAVLDARVDGTLGFFLVLWVLCSFDDDGCANQHTD